MNTAHAEICGSAEWAEHLTSESMPPTLAGIELGEDLLEVGPGYGAATLFLAPQVQRLTAVEIDPELGSRLQGLVPDNVEVLIEDASAMPLPDNRFSAAVCFTMLHHVPTPELQDKIFAEVFRVLAPGAWYAGSDSTDTPEWRDLHVEDICVPVEPAGLPDRLSAAGFVDVTVSSGPDEPLRFRGRKH